MKNKWMISLTILIVFIFIFIGYLKKFNNKQTIKTINPIVKSVETKILADGIVRSQNEVNLHFTTGGKLVYLPFKEGDTVRQGQTIASLDTYALQRQLNAALNTYRITRDSFDQLQDNDKTNYLDAQQANPYPYNYWNLGGVSGNTKTNAINDMMKRLVDQSQAGLDNSVIQVELANYALNLSSLTAPFDGVITHLDITTPYVVVSSANSFVMIDPDALVFRANVAENDVEYIREGVKATIKLTGERDKTIAGFITKIYPDKITLPTGENIYQVDIESTDLKNTAKYRQDGVVQIQNKYDHQVTFIPSWIVLNKKSVWILKNGKPKLVNVKIGNSIGDNIEIKEGLNSNDKLIANPQGIASNYYHIL